MEFESFSRLKLDPTGRAKIESFLRRFAQQWDKGALRKHAQQIAKLPQPVQRATLEELVRIDLQQRWSTGKHVRLERYLDAYPVLGDASSVSVYLIAAECESRLEAGKPVTLEILAERFPHQANSVLKRVGVIKPVGRAQQPGTDSPVASTTTIEEPNSKRPATELERPTTTQSGSTLSEANAGFVPSSAKLPERFGKYQVVKCIGNGGMGSVYLAHDTSLDRKVALKVPHPHLTADPDILRRFQIEARAAAAINHPNICTIHEVGEEAGFHFLAMAFVDGEDLCDVIQASKYTPREVAKLIRKLAATLQYAHEHKIIHRDLKPSNIRINRRGEPIIMDFGLARISREGSTSATRTGLVMGTLSYMPPEQAKGETDKIGPQSDVYSLGGVMYELLSGQPPFAGETVAVLSQILTSAPAPLQQLQPGIDQSLITICETALNKDVARRYQSMTDLEIALGQYLEGKEVSTPRPRAKSSSASRPATLVEPLPFTAESDRAIHKTEIVQNAQSPSSTPSPVVTAGNSTHSRPHRKFPLFLATAFIIAAVVVAIAVLRRPSPTPMGSVTFSIEPKNVEYHAFVNDVPIDLSGPTRAHTYEPGQYELRVECEGFQPAVEQFTVSNGINLPLAIRLEKLKATVGFTFRGPTNVDNFTVLLDNRKVGSDILRSTQQLDVGEHQIEISAPGYNTVKKSFQVSIGKNDLVRLSANRHGGTVKINLLPANARVQVQVDKKVIHRSRLSKPIPLDVGQHTISVTGSRYKPEQLSVAVENGKVHPVRIKLEEIERKTPQKTTAAVLEPVRPQASLTAGLLQPVIVNLATPNMTLEIPSKVDLSKYTPSQLELAVDPDSFRFGLSPFEVGSSTTAKLNQNLRIGIRTAPNAEVRLRLQQRKEKLGIYASLYVNGKVLKFDPKLEDRLASTKSSIQRAINDEQDLINELTRLNNSLAALDQQLASARTIVQRNAIIAEKARYNTTAVERRLRTIQRNRLPKLNRTREELESQRKLARLLQDRRIDYRIEAVTDEGRKEIASSFGSPAK